MFLPTSTEMDVVLLNKVIVYHSSNQPVAQLSQVVAEYESIWHDRGFAKLPKENWMKFPLK